MDDADLDLSQKKSLVPDLNVTRRGLGVLGLGAGYALAVQPVSAATIATDAAGLVAGEVRIPVADRTIDGYRAYPQGKTGAPVVLVVHEIFGVHEHIKDLCRRLAKSGYYAVSADLYARYGDATKVSDIPTLLSTIVSKTKDAEINSDLDATVRFAAGEKADTSKLAVIGFCWGGRVTWKYTAHNPGVKAASPFYGPLAKDPPPSPIDLAPQMKGRVMAFYGAKDTGIPLTDVEAMRAVLKASGDSRSSIVVYPDAPHGFNADYRPTYVEADAKDAWAKMLGWFKANGVG